ncbi:MAG: hypothetical protein V3U37_03550, partial [Nitrospinaceae bacterium]
SLRDIVQQADEEENNNRIGRREEDENQNQNQNPNRTEDREEDRVVITREAREANRAAEAEQEEQERQVEEPEDQQGEERGAAQILEDLEEDNVRGVRGLDDPAGAEAVQPNPQNEQGGASIRDLADTSGATDRFARAESGLDSDRDLTQEAQDEILPARIDRQNVSEAVQGQREQRDEAEAAEEPLLETPPQGVQPSDETAGAESARAAEAPTGGAENEEDEQQQQPDPAAVQTQIGQNVDRLI